MAEFSIVSSLICDEVRREITGKDIIIGVYSGDIVLASPAEIASGILGLTIYLEIIVKEIGEHMFDYKIEHNNKIVLTIDGIKLNVVDPNSPAVFPIGPVPIRVQEAGQLRFLVRMDQRKWRLFRTKDVKIGPGNLDANHPMSAVARG